ncbi:MAG: class I SAM-dependent methyltransferase [Bacteroides sp.]|nr:class I SAM-dependent methyltransferase [Prevotella sp.]MCM1408202.1 class I SAM-dependent methyltransferase [Treponema brennaborense]MCM1469526.1 class I SAM-dependent methyltransferase [Bacteroides sp.]
MTAPETEKTARQKLLFENRLKKRYAHLKKWAARTGITCFRLYDKDIPEIPLVLDIYKSFPDEKIYAQLSLYERPYYKNEAEEDAWLLMMKQAVSAVLSADPERIALKIRKKQHGLSQYEKMTEKQQMLPFVIREQDALFEVNLFSYLDTGIFFDHRVLRNRIRSECAGKRVLNLYCYTGAFSVYAALGNAARVDSVDMSKTYLEWAKRNFALNGFPVSEAKENQKYGFFQQDCSVFLRRAVPKNIKWDIIILDPPTFSNSKRSENILDLNRDWIDLVRSCVRLLSRSGVLYFSTNSRRLVFDESLIKDIGVSVSDISAETIPEDFRNAKIHRCWRIVRAAL